jgi:hypothetical protein
LKDIVALVAGGSLLLSLLFLWMMFAITLLGGKAAGGISGMITGAITPIVAIVKSIKGKDKHKSEFQEKIEKYNNQLSAKYNGVADKVDNIGSKVKIQKWRKIGGKIQHVVVDKGLGVDTDNVDPNWTLSGSLASPADPTKVHVL